MTLDELVSLALAEDLGPGDLTTEATVPPDLLGTARIVAKQSLVVSGVRAARRVFERLGVAWEGRAQDGDRLSPGDVLCTLSGPLAGVLSAERVALNLLMHLSGVATNTASIVAAAEGQVKVVCTRKTTPLLRSLEREAVLHGGASPHRYGLFDGILIKDNHIAAAGGVGEAIRRARAAAHHLVRIEVEVENLNQLREALSAGAEVILLDNMDDATLGEAVALAKGRALLEASGNMDAARIGRIKGLGLDFISVGGLIHQARWVDYSLRVDPVVRDAAAPA